MAADEQVVGKLEEEALKRKERLAALKRKQENQGSNDDNCEERVLPKPVFRSYKPQDEELQKAALPLAKPSDVESQVKPELEEATKPPVIDELDLANLAPRKPDFDLKRAAAKRLAKLERRTQKAIAELIRERLKNEDEGDLLATVAMEGGR
nr:EOG090X0KZ2 [Triops cancriformis]